MSRRLSRCLIVCFSINVSEYSDKHDIDAPYPIKYECIAHHVPLKSLEELTDPRLVPGSREFLEFANSQRSPFRHKSTIRSSSPLEHISLDDFYGSPYVIVVKYPNTVIMKSLLGHANSMLHLTPLAQWQDFVRTSILLLCEDDKANPRHVATSHQGDTSSARTEAAACLPRDHGSSHCEQIPYHVHGDVGHPGQQG